MNATIASTKTYLLVWAVLLALLFATWGIARFDLGVANIIIALLIAATQMSLVILFFMHLRYNTHITWIFAAAGFVWFSIMVSLTMTDYFTRGRVRPTNKTISFWNEPQKENTGQ